MKPKQLVCTVSLLLASAAAGAHAHLTESAPAEGSVVTAAPTKLVLKFSEAARITALSLQKDGANEQKLTPLPGDAARTFTLPLQPMMPGKYTANWRVLSDDGHIMSGKLHFTIAKSP